MSLRSASGRFRLPSARAVPKLVLAGLVVGLLLAADRVDPVAAGVAVAAGSGLEVLGFAASDYDDTAAGIDRDVAGLSTLAVTGATLGSHPGTVEIRPVGDGLVRAHLAGAEGLLVISNYDGRDWNGGRVRALVNDKEARRRFVSAVSSAMARSPWDGVVLDFENLDQTVRDGYPGLVAHLAEALRLRRVLVTVPAFTDPDRDDAAPFDLARLSANGVGIVWMAYDQHDPTSEAGPVAGLPWVQQTLTAALRSVPPAQLLLGVPAYGYAWPARGQGGEAADLTVPQAAALAGQTGARMSYDPVQAEGGGTLPDGRTLG